MMFVSLRVERVVDIPHSQGLTSLAQNLDKRSYLGIAVSLNVLLQLSSYQLELL